MIEDALPFALCLSAIVPTLDCKYIDNISLAHGNVVLVDHGRTLQPEPIGQVPLKTTQAVCECEGEPGESVDGGHERVAEHRHAGRMDQHKSRQSPDVASQMLLISTQRTEIALFCARF